MRSQNRKSSQAAPHRRVRVVDFDRTKYGSEMLIDVAWVSDMPAFLLDEPHALAFYDIILVTRGHGEFWLDGYLHRVEPGQLFFTTPGQCRSWRVHGLDGLCLFFPELFLTEFFHDAMFLHRLPYFHVRDGRCGLQLARGAAAGLRRLLLSMRKELALQRPDTSHLLRARLYEILISLARPYAEVHGVPADRAVAGLVVRFRQLVESDFRRLHHVADYAARLAVTPGHLSALCRRDVGQSAKAIIRGRLDGEARRLLLYTDGTAEGIGYALGFKDASYFTRFFRAVSGRTPAAFRREFRAAHREAIPAERRVRLLSTAKSNR